jgi:hypothetical protein
MNEDQLIRGTKPGQLDRLVDGELTTDEYRELLRTLDAQPDGWRRCALAFLESQAWSRELKAMRQEAEVTPPATTTRSAVPWRSARWPNLLAVAACFVIAFSLGLVFRAAWPGANAGPSPAIAERAGTSGAPTTVAEGDGQPTTPLVPRGSVQFVLDGGEQPVDVPVYDWSPEHAGWLSEQNPRVPSDVRRALQRLGGQLQWRRHVVPVRTQDGRSVLFPIDQLEITPVGDHRFQ